MQTRMSPKFLWPLAVLLLAFAMSVTALGRPGICDSQGPSVSTVASGQKKLWAVEDILLAETASAWQISPDGKRAVFVKMRVDKDKDGRISNVFLVGLDTKKEIQLTRGSDLNSRPKWSPDGSLISFSSTRALPKSKPDLAATQLWLINSLGGEPYPLTELGRAMRDYHWITSDTIYFSAQEDPALYELERKRKKDTTVVIDDVEHEPPVRLFRLSVKDGKITRLTDNTDFIENWAPSPDGKTAVASHQSYLSFEWDHKSLPRTYLHDLATGERVELFSGRRIVPAGFRWAKDGSGFYTVAPYSSDPRFFTAAIMVVYYHDVASGKTVQVGLDWQNGLAGGLEITNDGFLTLLADGPWLRPARYVKNGFQWQRIDVRGEHVRNAFDAVLSRDGRRLIYQYSTASTPAQWYVADFDLARGAAVVKDPVRLTDLNPGFKDKKIARTEVVRWKGALGEEIDGLLYYPHDYEPGKEYPLFTAPHGGPAGADLDGWDESWAYPHQIICQRGAFILKPNYHGSSNYGLKFVESINRAKYYEYPVEDIEKGVDHLIAEGLVDPDRIGTFGWSNSSILSIALSIANPDRYKVVGAGAGDVEFISDWANVDFGQSFDTFYFGKSPLEDPMLYVGISPFFKLDRVKAPTIIFFGTEDRNVPTDQGWSHYRALYHLDKVPVKFLLFPGEPHSLNKFSHQLRKVEEELSWFDRYFFKTLKAATEALKNDSALGRLLRLKKAASVGGMYGVSAPNGTLIPETVKHGGLEIGRFEVTRAQFEAFDSSYTFPPGTGNLPANGITQEKAKSYVDWLSKVTGESWRLPNEKEIPDLYGKPWPGENTLDNWAGYPLNPDDARRILEKVKELAGPAPLLKEVGGFSGSAGEDESVYDLGGNVAEWVAGKDGQLKVAGGSADTPADPKARSRAPAPEYIGLRVIKKKAM